MLNKNASHNFNFENSNSQELVSFQINQISDKPLRNRVSLISKYKEEGEKIKKNQHEDQSRRKLEYLRKSSAIYKDINTILSEKEPDSNSNSNSLSDFWYTVILNSNFFTINCKDRKVLLSLTRVWIEFYDDNSMSYQINFEFAENKYLSDSVLFKKFHYPPFNKDDIYISKDYSLNELIRIESSKVNWKNDSKNPSRRFISSSKYSKLSNNASKTDNFHRKSLSIFSKWEKIESFFDIFEVTEDMTQEEEQSEFFIEDMLPFCVEYYLNIVPKH